ncbi:chromosome partition protein [Streptococcus sp. NCTC 11567]|nr:chromosome partition protein [Streptococcus dysgalactiae subsp. equisimilis]VTT20406.1 chromosome partition protein [Streptococcus dysgalactiae subsp. equisimilis]VUC96923.1 chromosome partition protein [Streptococcus sp. NCTC 11567]
MATLTLAGLLSSTTVSANSYSNWNLTPEQRKQMFKERKDYREKARSLIIIFERQRKEMIENLKAFSDLTEKEKSEFITRVVRSSSLEEINIIHTEAVDRVNDKSHLYNEYRQKLRSGYRDSVTIDKSELRLYDYQNLKEIVEHLTK